MLETVGWNVCKAKRGRFFIIDVYILVKPNTDVENNCKQSKGDAISSSSLFIVIIPFHHISKN